MKENNILRRFLPHPVIAASLSALLILYIPQNNVFFFIGLVLLLAYLSMAVRVRKKYRREAVLLFFACVAGLCIGGQALLSHKKQSVYWGLHANYINKAQIRLTTFLNKTAKGYYKYQGGLLNVQGAFGMEASARGIILLIMDKEYVPGALLEISLDGADLEKGLVFVRSKEAQVIKRASAINVLRFSVRKGIEQVIEKAAGKAAPLVKALLIGYRGDLESTSVQAFTDAGCAHILALSGQHVAVLVLLLGTCIRLGIGKKYEFCICTVLLGLFVWITGASPSVVRAVLQFTLAGLFTSSGRPQKKFVVLGYTFLLAVSLYPASPYTLSFKLSYLAVVGILFCNDYFVFLLRRWFPYAAAQALAQGLSALAGTCLLSAGVFGKVNIVSPVTSALLSPLVTLLIAGGIVGGLIAGVLPWADVLFKLSRFILEHIEQVMLFLAKSGGRVGMLHGSYAHITFGLLACLALVVYCYNLYCARRFAQYAKQGFALQLEHYRAVSRDI